MCSRKDSEGDENRKMVEKFTSAERGANLSDTSCDEAIRRAVQWSLGGMTLVKDEIEEVIRVVTSQRV